MRKRVGDNIVNIWELEKFRVFLSHLARDKEQTIQIKQALEIYGISCFVAHEDIPHGLEWPDVLKQALNTMDALIAFMTVGFHESEWTGQEIGFAVCRNVPIISINHGSVPLGFIGKKQALKWKGAKTLQEILKSLMKNNKMINSYIAMIKNSSSFAESNRLAKGLPFIEKLSPQQVALIISAFNNNTQVNHSGFWGPSYYGEGLVFHLERLTGKQYQILGHTIELVT